MICPKCKKNIPEKSLKCIHCGVRIGSFCKKCKTYNSIYNLNCVKCNEELLKLCPSCKAVNLPNALECRKCSVSFKAADVSANEQNEKKEEQVVSLNYNANFCTQQSAKDLLVDALASEDKKIISLSGEKGVGKSIVLRASINSLKKAKMSWLFGECSALTQLSPCGLIQDILLTFFNVANFCSDGLKIKKDSQRFFQNEFPTLTNDEIFSLLNFLYPTNQEFYENILINKAKTFTFLEKVFRRIAQKSEAVIVIDNFEMIDGMSYEFLYSLINSGDLENIKFVLTYSELRPARGYLYNSNIEDSAYLDISLKSFDKSQIETFIDQYISAEKNCPKTLKDDVYSFTSGNPAFAEQMIGLVADFERKNNSFAITLPISFIDTLKVRLQYLKEDYPHAYSILSYAAVQGIKFYPALINQAMNLPEDELISILNLLQVLNFVVPVSEFAYSFKNTTLWTSIFEIIKSDFEFTLINENLLGILSNYTLSTCTLTAIIAQNLGQKQIAFNIWTHNLKLCSSIGDTNLYILSQKQCLQLLDDLEGVDIAFIKNNIFERLGKLLSTSNPQEASELLPNAIQNAKNNEDTLKEIELTGYLANCCIALGDYYGTIECVDSVISKVDIEFDLELAMLKSRKLDALLNIGNSGQIVNLIDNEILPVLEKYLNSKQHKNISLASIYTTWLKSYLTLANALVFQGDSRSFEVLGTLFDLFEKNQFDNQLFICKAKLALAFANTIKGDVESSENILEEVIKSCKTEALDNEAISRWNLINILNNFVHKKYTGLKEELFQVVTFANNVNDNFTKNILRVLLGKLLKDEDNAKQALVIYDDQITYFAKEKNAIGALLSWYLISEANLVVEGPDKAIDVAQKALEVAQNPKINNYIFITLFNKIMAEAYMAKSDFESAKIHIEKAIMVARKFELFDILAGLYHLYGKYLQDLALIKSDLQIEYVMGCSKMYKKAQVIAQSIKNNYMLELVEKSISVLKSFCQLNSITLKD